MIYGCASGNDKKILVTLQAPYILRTTIHELSHTIGAVDSQCIDGQPCVMRYGTSVSNQWCEKCKADIANYLDQ